MRTILFKVSIHFLEIFKLILASQLENDFLINESTITNPFEENLPEEQPKTEESKLKDTPEPVALHKETPSSPSLNKHFSAPKEFPNQVPIPELKSKEDTFYKLDVKSQDLSKSVGVSKSKERLDDASKN
jgi:hypothetical protein